MPKCRRFIGEYQGPPSSRCHHPRPPPRPASAQNSENYYTVAVILLVKIVPTSKFQCQNVLVDSGLHWRLLAVFRSLVGLVGDYRGPPSRGRRPPRPPPRLMPHAPAAPPALRSVFGFRPLSRDLEQARQYGASGLSVKGYRSVP